MFKFDKKGNLLISLFYCRLLKRVPKASTSVRFGQYQLLRCSD